VNSISIESENRSDIKLESRFVGIWTLNLLIKIVVFKIMLIKGTYSSLGLHVTNLL